jgi:hypothetical protein
VTRGLHFATANDAPNRDPITVTLEESTETDNAKVQRGSSWTLIYNESIGISATVDYGRLTYARDGTGAGTNFGAAGRW